MSNCQCCGKQYIARDYYDWDEDRYVALDGSGVIDIWTFCIQCRDNRCDITEKCPERMRFMNTAMAQADKNWREGNTIANRLNITAEDLAPFLRFSQRSGHVTLREDMTVQVAKRDI